MSTPSERALAETIRDVAVPHEVVEMTKTSIDPAPGQIWRARWNSRNLTILLITIHQGTLDCVPASISEPPSHKAGTRRLEPEDTGAALAISIWPVEQVALPSRVLDVAFIRETSALIDLADQLRVHGTPFHLPDTATSREAARRLDTIEVLQRSEWAPRPGRPLQELLKVHAVTASEVGALLGLDAASTHAILRGNRALEPDQMQSLAEATDIPLQDLQRTGPGLPDDLVHQLESPHNRHLVEHLRATQHLDDSEARIQLGAAAYALAARQTGSRQVDWRPRLQHALESMLEGHQQ